MKNILLKVTSNKPGGKTYIALCFDYGDGYDKKGVDTNGDRYSKSKPAWLALLIDGKKYHFCKTGKYHQIIEIPGHYWAFNGIKNNPSKNYYIEEL